MRSQHLSPESRGFRDRSLDSLAFRFPACEYAQQVRYISKVFQHDCLRCFLSLPSLFLVSEGSKKYIPT